MMILQRNLGGRLDDRCTSCRNELGAVYAVATVDEYAVEETGDAHCLDCAEEIVASGIDP